MCRISPRGDASYAHDRTDARSLTDAGGQPTTRIAWSVRGVSAAPRTELTARSQDRSCGEASAAAERRLLLGSATTRGASWAHARREPSVTVARAERKSHHQCLILFCRHTAHASRLPNRPCSRDKCPQRACRLLPPCGPRIGNQIGNRRGKRQRNGTKDRFRTVSAARAARALSPTSRCRAVPHRDSWPPSRRRERRGLRQAGRRGISLDSPTPSGHH